MTPLDEGLDPNAPVQPPTRKPFRLSRLFGARTIFGLAVVLSVLGYVYVIDIVDPRKKYDFIDDLAWVIRGQKYDFYSGSEGGFYVRIGKLLESRTAEKHGLKIRNVKTGGGLENARQVSSSSRSFGLVQEDTLARDDFLREHMRYVAPLYLERMHILYDSKALERDDIVEAYQEMLREQARTAAGQPPSEASGGPGGQVPESSNPPDLQEKTEGSEPALQESSSTQSSEQGKRRLSDDDTLTLSRKPSIASALLSSGTISTGPVGSGSQLFARYLMGTCGITEYNDQELSFDEAIRRLDGTDDYKVDVVFNIAGAPLPDIKRTLQIEGGRRFKLMSIDASLVPALNQEYGLRLQAASFKDKYPQGNKISTFGSWAFLIASKDASSKAVAFALNELEDGKNDIRRELSLEERNFQLSEFNFKEAFSDSSTGFTSRLIRNGIIFFMVILLLGSGMAMFGMWLISGIRKSIFYRELSNLYEALPENRRILHDEGQLPVPVIFPDQQEILERIVQGMSDSLRVSRRIRKAYSAGELRIAHYSLLTSTVQNLHSVFRDTLAQRLHEYFSNYGTYSPQRLRHYFTAGYLSWDGYQGLVSNYEVDEDVSGAPLLLEAPAESGFDSDSKTELFLSHRTSDNSFAVGRIRERLIAEFGLSAVFFDRESMPAGRDFREVLTKEVQRCDCLLAIIGPQWIDELHSQRSGQDYVLTEIETALKRGVPVIPVLLSPGRMPSASELPDSIQGLASRHAVVIRPDPEFHGTAELLIQKVRETVALNKQTDKKRKKRSNRSVPD